ncbi:MAG TPA: alpha/beta hydrolase-fold protein, partial [Puia sp.]|nr:alpha/beta hydrolase-fold protein [Puia sp.]
MQDNPTEILQESVELESELLNRTVKVDFYLPTNISDSSTMSLLLINDGQDMEKLQFSSMLEELYAENMIEPLLCIGIQAGERKMEYGTAKILDYKKRGARSQAYTDFIFEELLPFTHKNYNVPAFKEKAFAGFS